MEISPTKCKARTKDGVACRITPAKGHRYCHVHSRRVTKRWVIASIPILLAAVAVAANLSNVANWLGLKPPSFTKSVVPQELVDKLISESDSIVIRQPDDDAELTAKEQTCKTLYQDIRAAKCWTILGTNYGTINNYRRAFECFDRAFEADAQVGDPFYERGEAYFGLALMDLVRKKKFTISVQDMGWIIQPDEDSKVLFKKTLEEFDKGEKLPLIKESLPFEENVTTLYMIGHRRKQIQLAFEGSTSIALHKLDLFKLGMLVPLYAKDEKMTRDVMEMSANLLRYMKAHPDEFPHILPTYAFDILDELPPIGNATPNPPPKGPLTEEQTNDARELLFSVDVVEIQIHRIWNDKNDFGVKTDDDDAFAEGSRRVALKVLFRSKDLPDGDYKAALLGSSLAYAHVGLIRMSMGEPGGEELQASIAKRYKLDKVDPHLRAWEILTIARKARAQAHELLGVPMPKS